MEAVIFIGLQASGKSSFYKERFFATHVRISLDLLRTRNREQRLLAVCMETQQSFVIDNTNSTRKERAKYIDAAKSSRYSVVGYYFRSKAEECLVRNQQRTNQVPHVAILSTAKKLELPTLKEGFDTLRREDRRHERRHPLLGFGSDGPAMPGPSHVRNFIRLQCHEHDAANSLPLARPVRRLQRPYRDCLP